MRARTRRLKDSRNVPKSLGFRTSFDPAEFPGAAGGRGAGDPEGRDRQRPGGESPPCVRRSAALSARARQL